MQLYIGNKNYSSWSMRPWVLMTHFGLPFEEVLVRFDSFDPGSRFKAVVGALAPTGKVPLLVDGRPGRLGLAGHCRDPGRALPAARCGRPTRRPGPAPAACAPRCTAASAPCATPAR
jgi:hypothetical protein